MFYVLWSEDLVFSATDFSFLDQAYDAHNACETLKWNQELKYLERLWYSFIQEKSVVGLHKLLPPKGETPPLSLLEKVQPNTGNEAPRVHWVTLGFPTFLWEFWVTSVLGWRASHPRTSCSFCYKAFPHCLSGLISSVPLINLYSCYTRAHHSLNLPCTLLTPNALCPYLHISPCQQVYDMSLANATCFLCEAFLEISCSVRKPFIPSVQNVLQNI